MTKEEIILKIKNRILENEAEKKAWESVKRLCKKDGSNFAYKQKNIVGAEFGKYYPCEDYSHPYLTVFYKANNRYLSESIPMFEYVDNFKKDDSRLKNESQIIDNGISRNTYLYCIDECFKAINDYINVLNKRIGSYKKQLLNVDKFIEKADLIISQIKKLLNDNCLKDDFYSNMLGYSIAEYINKNI